ncbi:MAG: hypothetical protein GTN84_01300 [Hydrogenophaga sp.]|uniref:PglL family O-oligosaccharyltransferase n=1 Tax=Hydrogenophaga sp. TaxID=1904254 RepID=UPI0016AC95BC|nr:O-antigen ligase family protein [Hydrogenophaga sp.]NIM39789.1 hypothetical protein [Hydrogenophaga sp.]NIN24993.1 hypothetical protein [Hydrogenophaga sp.]NIN29505.1 hypothetical protein [Hydrogenophaga sp.]NIN54028.1 hypothetical protein [Hydrogenophaga sp.]NIO88418.1 hypothetical protein [Hydrogenophaga sp.]
MPLFFLAGWGTTTHISPWVSWHAELPFFVGAILIAWLQTGRQWNSGVSGGLILPVTVWPFVILILATLGQWAAGRLAYAGTALVVVLYLGLMLVCQVIGRNADVRNDRGAGGVAASQLATILAGTLLVASIASVALALAQVTQVWEGSAWVLRTAGIRRPGGNLGQPNHLSTLLMMGMAAVAYFGATSRLSKLTVACIVGFLCLGLAITESRTGLVCLVVLSFWWAWKQPMVAPNVPRWIPIPFVSGYLFVLMIWPEVYEALGGVLYEGARVGAEGAIGDARMTIWPQLWKATAAFPWLGWGMRETTEAHASVLHAYASSLPLAYSHNIILDLALWTGWPLTLALLLLSLYWLCMRTSAIDGPLAWFGMALVLPLAIHSLFEFPFAYAYLLAPAMLGMGLVEANVPSSGPRLRIRAEYMALLLAPLSAIGAWSAIDYLRLEEDFRAARFEMLKIGAPTSAHQRPPTVILTQLEAVVRAARMNLHDRMSLDDLEALRIASTQTPWSGLRYKYARALALNQQLDAAAKQLQLIRVQYGAEVQEAFRRQLTEDNRKLGVREELPQY